MTNYRFFETPIFIDDTSESLSPTNGGSLVSKGGVSISKNLQVGNTVQIYSTENASSLTSGGALTLAGGASVGKKLYVGTNLIVNSKDVTPSLGDISRETRSLGNNNQSTQANISNFIFDNNIVRSFNSIMSVEVLFLQPGEQGYIENATSTSLYATYEIKGIQKNNAWSINYTHIGDTTNIVFSITNSGQVQYTSPDYGGNFKELAFRFRATTTSIYDISLSGIASGSTVGSQELIINSFSPWINAGQEIYYTGNVGINTSNPSTSLDVNGSCAISQNLTVGNHILTTALSTSTATVGSLYVNGNTIITGNLQLYGAGNQVTIESTTLNIGDNKIKLNSGPLGLADSGLLISRGTLGSYASVFYNTPNNEFTFGYTNSDDTTGSIELVADSVSGQLYSTISVHGINANGNINATSGSSSIGTVLFTPIGVGSNMIPSSDITFDLGSTNKRWRDLYLSGSTIYLNDIPISASTNGTISFGSTVLATNTTASHLTSLGGMSINSSQWSGTVGSSLSYNSGNVGIGITSPTFKLDVNGTTRSSKVTIYNTSTSTSGTIGSALIVEGGAAVSKDIYIGNNLVLNQGNIGIGTTFPVYTLDVNTGQGEGPVQEYPPAALTADTTTFQNAAYGNGTYVVTYSSVSSNSPSSGTQGWKAFDKNVSSTYITQTDNYNTFTRNYIGSVTTTDILNVTYPGEWLQIKLPDRVLLKSYSIYSPKHSSLNTHFGPYAWALLVSNDGVSWYNLDEEQNQTFLDVYNTYSISTNNANSLTPFMYFRFVFTKGGLGSANVWIRELYLSASTPSRAPASARVTGKVDLTSTTDATGSSSGGVLTVMGGAAISKKLYVGTDLNLASTSSVLVNNTKPFFVQKYSSLSLATSFDTTVSTTLYPSAIISSIKCSGTQTALTDVYLEQTSGTWRVFLNKSSVVTSNTETYTVWVTFIHSSLCNSIAW